MTIGEMTALSLALGADLFSVAVPLGMGRIGLRDVVRLSAVFALCHIILLIGGISAGTYLAGAIERLGRAGDAPCIMVENWASVFGGAVLAAVGLHLLWESRKQDTAVGTGIPRGGTLLLLAVGVSCDALAVGLGMGLMSDGWARLSAVLGVVIFFVSAGGLLLGRRIGCALARYAQPLGALVLASWGIYAVWRALR